MKLLKKFFLITLLTISGITAFEFNFGSDDGLDDIAALTNAIPHEHANTLRTDEAAGFTVINSLANGYASLKDQLYYYTRPTRRRSLLDSDLFSFNRYYYFDKGLCITPFFMQTWKAHLYSNKTSLNGYLNLVLTDLIELVDQFNADEIDIPEIFQLVHNAKVQERRLGTMFEWYTPYKNWNITWMLPFLYQEHNFYLTKKEIKAITDRFNLEEDIEFAQQHLISDKLGIGDLRINLEKPFYETEKHLLTGGFDLTLPTGFAFSKGIFGNYFNKKTPNPSFNLQDDILNQLENQQQLLKNGEDLGLSFLDRLASVLLEHPLGNGGHCGIGTFIKHRFNFRPDWYFNTKVKAQIELPKSEYRFFRERYSNAEVDAISAAYADDISDANARIQLDKINELLLKMFFVKSYKTTVFPGAFFQGTFHFVREFENWSVRFGTDLWYHTKEHLSGIQADSTVLTNLDVEKGRMGHAFQQNFFLGLDRHHKDGAYFDWSFYTNYTAFSYGIGKTFTMGIKISHEF